MRDNLRTIWRMANLQAGHTRWYDIRAQDSGSHQVTIYDEIGFLGITAQEFVNDIKNVTGDLDIHINSPGGNIFDGLAIYNTLKQRPGRVSVVIDGLAASAASFIAQAASPGELAVAATATMMIHDGYGAVQGNASDARELADILDKQSDVIAGIYAQRSGRPAAQWRELMKAETWYGAGEAVSAGLADRILADAVNVLRNAWDAASAMSKCHDAADFRKVCAGEHTHGDPDTQAHWALPHHDSPGAGANPDGVSAALGALNGARGGVKDLKDPAAARRHLEAHQSAEGQSDNHSHTDIGLEYDPELFLGLLKGAVK